MSIYEVEAVNGDCGGIRQKSTVEKRVKAVAIGRGRGLRIRRKMIRRKSKRNWGKSSEVGEARSRLPEF